MALVDILATAILPVVAVATAGFALGRFRGTEPGPLNTVTVYVLAPALVLHSLATTPLAAATMGKIAVVVFVVVGTLTVVAATLGWASGTVEPLLGAVVLVVAFPNTGNFGIPVADFAFPSPARSVAVLVTAMVSVSLYTLGVYVAARGSGENWLANVRRVFGVPLVYAVVAALAARYLGVVPPADSTAMTTLGQLGDASIPVMLLVLGMQLAHVDASETLRPVAAASALRLVLGPVVALVAVLLVGFENQTVARVLVLLLGCPSGVTPIILVGAFSERGTGIAPGAVVSATVFATTILSVATVTALIAVLQSGVVL